ncbi:hypothetical protein V6N11_002997 [Hibiscus sabdariffa]|uniref:Remorin C-terminal domain-containing protein n=1 Tax=Hibiscus sabdariffa TaxID=183260 RepID=A0ABR2SC62_9ROSI
MRYDQATLSHRSAHPDTATSDGPMINAAEFVNSLLASNNDDLDEEGERAAVHNCLARSYSRPMSSKWNDAEKWIMNRQNVQATCAKKNAVHNQFNRYPLTHMVRVAPDSANYDQRLAANGIAETKRVDFYHHAVQLPFDKFSFIPSGAHPISAQSCGGNILCDQFSQSKDLKEVPQRDLSRTKSSEDTTVIPAMRSVCMRDMGTEMTPVASQEPSRTATPVGATTPLRSPTSSIPSTPRGGAPTSTTLDHNIDGESQHCPENGRKELSEKETKLKTRREIVALGVQLGKMNIASWASKDEKEDNTSSGDTTHMEKLEWIEYDKRAAAWEEAEKSKHTARYKREEIKLQAWESQQRAKVEAEMRRIEAKVERMRSQSQAKMVKKIAMARQRSEEKLAAAEARKNRYAERTAAQAEYIRQTGRMPSSSYMCCVVALLECSIIIWTWTNPRSLKISLVKNYGPMVHSSTACTDAHQQMSRLTSASVNILSLFNLFSHFGGTLKPVHQYLLSDLVGFLYYFQQSFDGFKFPCPTSSSEALQQFSVSRHQKPEPDQLPSNFLMRGLGSYQA